MSSCGSLRLPQQNVVLTKQRKKDSDDLTCLWRSHDPASCDWADKRAHHNALERKRRDHIKDSFHSLRDSVPALQGEKASRAQILDKATEYIQYMRRKNHTHQQDIDDLKRQNALLEQQVRALEKVKAPRSSSPTTRRRTAACTPTPKAAPCPRSTAAPTPAPSRNTRTRPPGRSSAPRPAKGRRVVALHTHTHPHNLKQERAHYYYYSISLLRAGSKLDNHREENDRFTRLYLSLHPVFARSFPAATSTIQNPKRGSSVHTQRTLRSFVP
ncbi:hypothetical protein WMY93_015806 [Mugilogobius chulae]|uniref:Protein max n=1 Tax=Mugilogobius chulae TaxID=88201 RepID=A0AAW0NVS8_9GOBI